MPPTNQPRTFRDVLSAAIDDLVEHGFDSVARVERWTSELRAAADRSMASTAEMELMMRDALSAIYRRLIDNGQVIKTNPGVARFTLERVRPELRSELDRRIMAAANLIKLNRTEAIDQTIRRFQGWSTSIPPGGTTAAKKPKTKREIRKSIAGLPFVERRVLTDQSHKLVASINEIVAKGGGAIAMRWSSRWRQPGYNYRIHHRERDKKVFLIRDSWAHQAGLVKRGTASDEIAGLYYDEVTAVGQEVSCRCSGVFLYALRDLPRGMLTEKGKAALETARAQAEHYPSHRADAADKKSKADVGYLGPFMEHPHNRRCDECTMFRKPFSCTAVAGEIDPGGWCHLFEVAARLSA